MLKLEEEEFLKSTLIIVEDPDLEDLDSLTGRILPIMVGDETITLRTIEGDRCVNPTPDALFFYFDGSDVDQIPGIEVLRELQEEEEDLNATVFGDEDDSLGCFNAEIIYSFRPELEAEPI